MKKHGGFLEEILQVDAGKSYGSKVNFASSWLAHAAWTLEKCQGSPIYPARDTWSCQSLDLITYATNILVGGILTPLKKMKVHGRDYPIYEMENNIHVPNHQPIFLCQNHELTNGCKAAQQFIWNFGMRPIGSNLLFCTSIKSPSKHGNATKPKNKGTSYLHHHKYYDIHHHNHHDLISDSSSSSHSANVLVPSFSQPIFPNLPGSFPHRA